MRRIKSRLCHKCPHDGMKSAACLSCTSAESYDYSHGLHVADGYDAPQAPTVGSAPITAFGEDVEDGLRRFLFDLFDLAPLELLLMRAIMRGKSLTDFARETAAFASAASARPMTRHHAFQLRKSMLAKLGGRFSAALLTNGQKRSLKSPPSLRRATGAAAVASGE